MIFVFFLVIWSSVIASSMYWGWTKIESNLKVHLMFLLNCIYFVGIFSGYAVFHDPDLLIPVLRMF